MGKESSDADTVCQVSATSNNLSGTATEGWRVYEAGAVL